MSLSFTYPIPNTRALAGVADGNIYERFIAID